MKMKLVYMLGGLKVDYDKTATFPLSHQRKSTAWYNLQSCS